MREFVVRVKLPDGPPDRANLALLLDELAIWVGDMPDEDGNLTLRSPEEGSDEVVGFAQLQTIDAEFSYEEA